MLIKIIVFFILIITSFFVLGINPFSPLKKLKGWKPKKKDKNYTVKSYLTEIGGKRKENIIKKSLNESKSSLQTLGQAHRYKQNTKLALVVGILAGFAGLVFFKSILLMAVLGIGCGLIPLWITKLSVYAHNERVNSELETALSMITVSYGRTRNIVSAIEEAVPSANFPIKDVLENFLWTIQNIDFNIPVAVEQMKKELDNTLFHQWCDVLILCQDDHSLSAGLQPIIAKLSTIKQQQEENKTLMMQPLQQTKTMIALVCSIIPLLMLLNKDWYGYLVGTIAGQTVMAVVAIEIFATIHKAINLSKPVEYRL